MNIQNQDIEVVQHETKWQVPELVELGNISCNTKNGHGIGSDGTTIS